jgi:hypothetical protein
VENQGTCNWNENYRLKLIAGTEISTPTERTLFPARSGTRAIINIQLSAPAEPGNYHSAWQAYSPSGEPFGDPIFIEIVFLKAALLPDMKIKSFMRKPGKIINEGRKAGINKNY